MTEGVGLRSVGERDRRREVGREDILLNSWDGEAPLIPLIQDILAQEQDLVGDQLDRILWYIGYEYLDVGNAE